MSLEEKFSPGEISHCLVNHTFAPRRSTCMHFIFFVTYVLSSSVGS